MERNPFRNSQTEFGREFKAIHSIRQRQLFCAGSKIVINRQAGSIGNRSGSNKPGDGFDLRRRFAECISVFCTFDWHRGKAVGRMIPTLRQGR
jgi:hypothetical protein